MRTIISYIAIILLVGFLFFLIAVSCQKSKLVTNGGFQPAMIPARQGKSDADNDIGTTLSFLRVLTLSRKKKSHRRTLKPTMKKERYMVAVVQRPF
jgi:hypothetical protein